MPSNWEKIQIEPSVNEYVRYIYKNKKPNIISSIEIIIMLNNSVKIIASGRETPHGSREHLPQEIHPAFEAENFPQHNYSIIIMHDENDYKIINKFLIMLRRYEEFNYVEILTGIVLAHSDYNAKCVAKAAMAPQAMPAFVVAAKPAQAMTADMKAVVAKPKASAAAELDDIKLEDVSPTSVATLVAAASSTSPTIGAGRANKKATHSLGKKPTVNDHTGAPVTPKAGICVIC